jgi:hypothetical protein
MFGRGISRKLPSRSKRKLFQAQKKVSTIAVKEVAGKRKIRERERERTARRE